MHVIGHEDISVKGAAGSAQRLAQPVEIGVVVVFGEEAWPAVVAALYDVQRDAGKVNARSARHDGIASGEPKLSATAAIMTGDGGK
jgi:hypothetical protein